MNDPQEQAGFGQTFGPVLVPALNVTKNSWTPVYPDWIAPPRALLAAAVPFFFMAATIITPAVPTFAQAIYPDQIPRRVPAQTLRLGTMLPAASTAQGGGLKVTPQILRQRHNYQGWYVIPELVVAAVQVYGQAAYYPDRIDRQLPDYAGWFAQPTLDQPVPRYQWRGSAPEQIFDPRPQDPGWYTRPTIEPPDIARLGWRGLQPSWIPPRRALDEGWYAKPLNEPPDIQRYGWRGQYPVWNDQQDPFPQGWYTKPVDAPDVTGFQWRGVYPAWFPERRAQQPPAAVLDPFPRPAQIQLGWAAYYPDWFPERRAQDPGWYTKPVQNPQLVPLSWGAVYPDRALRRELVPDGWYTLGYPVVAPVAYWTPVYPDWLAVRPTIQPAASQLPPFPLVSFGWYVPPPPLPGRLLVPDPGWSVRPLREPDDIARLGWRGVQPEWLRHLTPVLTPYLVVDPFPRPPGAPTYGWVVIYPDWVPPRNLVPTGLFVTIIDPIAPPPITVIGVEALAGLGQKKPFSSVGELGGGGW